MDKVLNFVSTGGYAFDHYQQFHKLVKGVDGLWRIASKRVATRWKMNIGTIVESVVMKVRLKGGPVLGEIEEYFVQNLSAGDSHILQADSEFSGVKANIVEVRASTSAEPKVPPITEVDCPSCLCLADTVRGLLRDSSITAYLPPSVQQWLAIQNSALPFQMLTGCWLKPAGRKTVSCLPCACRTQCPSDAWHAADTADGASGLCTYRVCCHRLCDSGMVSSPRNIASRTAVK